MNYDYWKRSAQIFSLIFNPGLKWAVGSGIVLSGLTAVAAAPYLLSLFGFTSGGKMFLKLIQWFV